jgi:hypothetical protein
MDAKHRTVQLLGFMALAVACLLCLAGLLRLLSGGLNNRWNTLDDLFVLAFGVYLIFVAVRAWDWAAGKSKPKTAAVSWGKVLLGTWMIYSPLKNQIHPAANLLKPSNDAQAVGMAVSGVILALLGVWVLVLGIRSRFRSTIPETD